MEFALPWRTTGQIANSPLLLILLCMERGYPGYTMVSIRCMGSFSSSQGGGNRIPPTPFVRRVTKKGLVRRGLKKLETDIEIVVCQTIVSKSAIQISRGLLESYFEYLEAVGIKYSNDT